MVTSHTDQNTKRLSCINLHDHTHQAQPNPLASWRWSYQHGKSYTRWLHHTPIKTGKDYHVSTFLIKRIKHNPTILALELSTWKELKKMVTSHTDQYTKRLSCINLHDHTHQAQPNHLASWRWSYQHGKSYARWLHHTPINTRKDYHAATFMIIRIKHNPTILAFLQLHLISRAQWSLVNIKTALNIMINIRRCDQTSRWSLIVTADIVPALGSLPTFRSISN